MTAGRVSKNDILSVLEKKFRDRIYTYASPTTDHAYKRVFLCKSDGIKNSFCNALLKMSMPDVPLAARKAEIMNEYVDAERVSFYLTTKNGAKNEIEPPQNLKVDALFKVDLEDSRRSARVPQTRSNLAFQKPACVLGEMQVCRQDFGIRLLDYINKIGAPMETDLNQGKIPLCIYGVGLCMWNDEDGNFIKNLGIMRSCGIDADLSSPRNFTEMAACNVYLDKLSEINGNDTRKSLDEKLAKKQKHLKQKVIKFFKKEGHASLDNNKTLERIFKNLSDQEKEVYLWLEFITCANLMTEAHANKSLEYLSEDARKEIFKQAYKTMDIRSKKVNIKSDYPDIWGVAEAQAKAERAQAETKKTKAKFDKLKNENTELKKEIKRLQMLRSRENTATLQTTKLTKRNSQKLKK